MENMESFFCEALFINHINFSGMNLGYEQIMLLLKLFKRCHFMIGIHLNNNGITLSKKYFKEVMRLFDIREADLIACNRSKEADAKGEPPITGECIDYYQYLRKYFTLASPDP